MNLEMKDQELEKDLVKVIMKHLNKNKHPATIISALLFYAFGIVLTHVENKDSAIEKIDELYEIAKKESEEYET